MARGRLYIRVIRDVTGTETLVRLFSSPRDKVNLLTVPLHPFLLCLFPLAISINFPEAEALMLESSLKNVLCLRRIELCGIQVKFSPWMAKKQSRKNEEATIKGAGECKLLAPNILAAALLSQA
eukprot:Gb_20790 [translate_table: standard]